MKPKVIDLFAGVGGMSLGFKHAGFNVVLANEYDSSIAASYQHNLPNTNMIIGDITKLDLQQTFGVFRGKIDVVIGGPPCQGFSQKGQRKTINDPRNFLFKHFAEVVKLVRPTYFVMENVPNILTAENGYFKREIIYFFNDLGYQVSADVLNAADYGVPQNRRRAVILGKMCDTSISLPEPKGKKVTVWDAISDLAFLESGEGDEMIKYPMMIQSHYQEELRDGSDRLYNHIATKHSNLALQRLSLIPTECGKEVLPDEHLTKSIYSGTWCRMKKDDVSVTITTRFDTPSSGRFTHPFLNRAITVREAARLQSFPDTFHFIGNKSSQMKQVGNAVPPKLAQAIANRIMSDIRKHTNEDS